MAFEEQRRAGWRGWHASLPKVDLAGTGEFRRVSPVFTRQPTKMGSEDDVESSKIITSRTSHDGIQGLTKME